MKTFNIFTGAPLRAAAIGLLAAGLLIPAAASAAPDVTGTLVGVVSCGAGQHAPAARVVVAVEGMDLSTHSTDSGLFLLTVPGGQTVTVNAVNPSDGSVASRFNVVVHAGETLDVGELDLQVCPQPVLDSPTQTEQPQEDARDLPDQG